MFGVILIRSGPSSANCAITGESEAIRVTNFNPFKLRATKKPVTGMLTNISIILILIDRLSRIHRLREVVDSSWLFWGQGDTAKPTIEAVYIKSRDSQGLFAV